MLGGNPPSKNMSKGQTNLHPGPTDKWVQLFGPSYLFAKHSGTNMIAHHCPGCWGCWLRWPLYPLSNFSVSDFWHDLWATFDMQSADMEWLLCLWHLTWSLGHIWYAVCWHSCGQSTAERLAVSQGLDVNTLEKVPFKYSNFKSWEYWKIICFLKWNSVKCCLVKLCRATHHLKCPKSPYRNRSTRMARVTDVYKPVCPRNIWSCCI